MRFEDKEININKNVLKLRILYYKIIYAFNRSKVPACLFNSIKKLQMWLRFNENIFLRYKMWALWSTILILFFYGSYFSMNSLVFIYLHTHCLHILMRKIKDHAVTLSTSDKSLRLHCVTADFYTWNRNFRFRPTFDTDHSLRYCISTVRFSRCVQII